MTGLSTPGMEDGFKGSPFPRDVERVYGACRRMERCSGDAPAPPWELTFPHACKCLALLHKKYQTPLLFSSLTPESVPFVNWVGRQSSPQDETFHNEQPTYKMGSLLTVSSKLSSPRACSIPGASRPHKHHANQLQVILKSTEKGTGFQEVIR